MLKAELGAILCEYALNREGRAPPSGIAVFAPITSGWSDDRKFYAETVSGERLFLRVSAVAELNRKRDEYKMLTLAEKTGILLSRPLEFGLSRDGTAVYQLHGWLDGENLLDALPKMSGTQRRAVGEMAGRTLRRIHSVAAPESVEPWSAIFARKIESRLDQLIKADYSDPTVELLIDYVSANADITRNRPQTLNHGDYSVSNLILTPENELGVIDFNAFTSIRGDPWWEFCSIPYAQEPDSDYYSGVINGYFGETIPADFFAALAFYYAYDGIAAICECLENTAALEDAKRHGENIAGWFKDMSVTVPTWYKRDS